MFCKFCGNQVPDGEVCFCEQAVAQRTAAAQQPAPSDSPVAAPAAPAAPAASIDVNAIFNKVLSGFKSLLKDVTGAGTSGTAAVAFAVTGLLMHILAWICMANGLVADLPIKLKGLAGTAAWCGCLCYGLPLVLVALGSMLGAMLRKAALDIKTAFIRAASISVAPAVLFLLGGLLSTFSFGIGLFVIIIALMTGLVSTYKVLAKQFGTANDIKTVLINALVLGVIVGLTAYVEYGVIKNFISGVLSNLLSDLLGGFGGMGGMGGLFG